MNARESPVKSTPKILALIAANLMALAGFAAVTEWVLGRLDPGLPAASVVADPPQIAPDERPAASAIYRGGTLRGITLREWAPGATLREPVPQPPATDHRFAREWYDTRIDSDGFIVPSRTHADPDATIAFLGGSTTETLLMSEDERFPAATTRLLESTIGLKINALNAGRSGNHTQHALLIYLAKIEPYRPSVVVLMENINDVAALSLLGSYHGGEARAILFTAEVPKSRLGHLRDSARSALLGTFPNIATVAGRLISGLGRSGAGDEFAAARAAGPRPPAMPADEMAAVYAGNLRRFVALVRARGSQPVLMTQPSRLTARPDAYVAAVFARANNPIGYDAFAGLHARFNDIVRETARALDVPLVDLDLLVPKDSDHIYDVVHMTGRGSLLAAEAIAHTIAPLLSKRP